MSTEASVKVASSIDTVESLMQEAEILKAKLEDERQKLNDVTCKVTFVYIIQIIYKFLRKIVF